MQETSLRSVVKTLSWRATGTLSTFIISLIVLGSFSVAGSIAVVQLTVNTLLYFMHERIWNRISWGKQIDK
jgi:uncharacterized membrane protein